MIRKDTYKIAMTRRQMLSVGDRPDHYLMLTEMEGKPLGEKVGVAGEFVSRRAVGYQDSLQGSGRLEGYVVETFREGTIFSRYEGSRDAASKTSYLAYALVGEKPTFSLAVLSLLGGSQ
ncbi:MAG: hypothetical protein P8017_16960 [Deltaproteobacteria bacterium]